MADNETKPSANDGREELVAKQLASTKIHLALTQKRVDVSGAIKLPLERIPQLGVAFASLRSMFRTVTNTVSVPTLLQATDKYGTRSIRRNSTRSRTAAVSQGATATPPRALGRRAST